MKFKEVNMQVCKQIITYRFNQVIDDWLLMKELEDTLISRYGIKVGEVLSKYMVHRIINSLTIEKYGEMQGQKVEVILNHKKISRIHQWSLK